MSKQDEFNIMSNYEHKNQEINELHLTFSKLSKIVVVARNSLNQGDENEALLNYNEVAKIFKDMKNFENYGKCMNNIGCLYLKKSLFN